MSWFVAHSIILVSYKDGVQDNFPIWENMILIKAKNRTEANKKAIEYAKLSEGDDNNSFTCDSRPARRVFIGIRKLNECLDCENNLRDICEITYSKLEVGSQDDLNRLVSGFEVNVIYEE